MSKFFMISKASKKDAVKSIYRFLTYESINNPEVSIMTMQETGKVPTRISYSRNGDYGYTIPDENTFERLSNRDNIAGILCVASTDPEDTRRVTVAIMQEMGEGKLLVSFPKSDELTVAEERILERLKMKF